MAKDLEKRICIIGGGPAGLSQAMYLEKEGYNNYSILEKAGEVGGKCHSPHYKGKRYETGAVMGADSYYSVMDVMEFCGDVGKHLEGPPLGGESRRANGKLYDPFNPKNPKNLPRLLKTKKQVKKWASLMEGKYKGYDINGHRGVSEGKYDGFLADGSDNWVEGENENLKDLAMPFKDFCELNGIEHVQDILMAPFVSFGYGFYDEIPAAYVLKYLDVHTAMRFINGDLWTWKDGTQSIWESLNDHLKHPARLNSYISKVERKDDKVYVTVNGEVEEYDCVIITAPLQYMDEYFDATPEEKELFSKIDYERYDVIGCVLEEGYPEKSGYIYDNMTPKRLGDMILYYCRWRGEPDQVITAYCIRNHRNEGVKDYEECKEKVLKDMEICGMKVKEIEYQNSWYYFPHIFTEDYKNGWYEKVEAMQGKNNTYYAGEIMSFGDMEEVAEYSKSIVHRFFK